jgi:tRNA G18 (ribose-2'-O)-methylase SpoU
MRRIIIVAHNLRSAHNVGSLLRTAEGLGIERVYLTGYTPYPAVLNDTRVPYIAAKVSRRIEKTALGAEKMVSVVHEEDINRVIGELKNNGFLIAGLEQHEGSASLHGFKPPDKIALLVGREVEGIEKEVLERCDEIVEIPMLGKKESFNVVQAAAMALYHFRFS